MFPDVIFQGAILRVTDQYEWSLTHIDRVGFYPRPSHLNWWSSYTDTGGSWQSEPMMEFMRYCLQTGNSPYWNPFSGAGALGPETLIDEKFSIFTLLYAAFGGDSFVFDAIFILAYVAGTYFTALIVLDYMKLSWLAALAACIVYLLNGYDTANVTSNISENYLLVPACLYAALQFTRTRLLKHFLYMTVWFALLSTCSFMPTEIVAVMTIFGLVLGASFDQFSWTVKHVLKTFLYCVAALFIGFFLILAPLYWPFIESLSDTGIADQYLNRHFYPANIKSVLSLFTPSHFYESYNAIDAAGTAFSKNTIYHFGIVMLTLSACALPFQQRNKWLLVACAAMLFLTMARLFGFYSVSEFIDHIPILGNLGGQYLWASAVFPLIFLCAAGTENLKENKANIFPVFILFAGAIASGLAIWKTLGLTPPYLNFKIMSLGFAAGLMVIVFISIHYMNFISVRGRTIILLLLLIAGFAELTFDDKFIHITSHDFFTNPPDDITFLKKNIKDGRTLTLATAGGIAPEQGSAFQIPEVTTVNMGTLPNYAKYFFHAINLDPSQIWGDPGLINQLTTAQSLEETDWRTLDTFESLGKVTDQPELVHFNWEDLSLLGVKYVIIPSNYKAYQESLFNTGFQLVFHTLLVNVFENPHVMPRAFAIESAVVNAGKVDLNKQQLIGIKPVDIALYSNAHVDIKGFATSQQVVVLTDTWHKNWTATANGKQVEILHVNGLFRGVLVPPGPYEISMRYQPKTLLLSLITSGLTILSGIGYIFYRIAQKLNSALIANYITKFNQLTCVWFSKMEKYV